MNFTLFILYFLVLFSAFSWININGFKILPLVSTVFLFKLITKVRLFQKLIILIIFFCFMALYDILLSAYFNTLTLTVLFNIVSLLCNEIIFVYLIAFFSRQHSDVKLMVINLLTKSITIYAFIVLIVFFLFPQYKGTVILSDKFGIRLCGFSSHNPNGYALICLIGAIVTIHDFINKRTFLACFSMICCLVSLVFIQSRAALFAIALYVVYEISLFEWEKIIKIINVKTAFFIGVLLVISICCFDNLCDNVFNNIKLSRFSENAQYSMHDVSVDDFHDERGTLIMASFDTLTHYPFGIGSAEQEKIIFLSTGIPRVSHSIFINYFVTYGFLFGTMWIVLIAYLLWKTFSYLIYNQTNRDQVFLLSSGIVLSIFVYLAFHIQNWYPIWIILAIHCSFFVRINDSEDKNYMNV